MKLIIDIDGVIFKNRVEEIKNASKSINRLYQKGHRIILFTARYKCDSKKTKGQLKELGIKYHKIIFNKPLGDYYIDDKAIVFKNNWEKICQKFC